MMSWMRKGSGSVYDKWNTCISTIYLWSFVTQILCNGQPSLNFVIICYSNKECNTFERVWQTISSSEEKNHPSTEILNFKPLNYSIHWPCFVVFLSGCESVQVFFNHLFVYVLPLEIPSRALKFATIFYFILVGFALSNYMSSMFLVPWCDIRHDFHVKRCSIHLDSHLFYRRFLFYLYYICIYLRILGSNRISISKDVHVTLQ